jgi:hypothetical protein
MARPDPRIRWIAPIAVAVVALLAYWWLHPKQHVLGEAYISQKSVTLLSSTAEVTQNVATLHYGDHVTILTQQGALDQVRIAAGATGWMDSSSLMSPGLWQASTALLARAQGMEVQARGYAKTVTNVHITPGRSSDRIYQFARNVPVVILSRAAAVAPAEASGDEATPAESVESKPKLEDWLLVMRDPSASTVPLPAEGAAVNPVTPGATMNSTPASDEGAAGDTGLPMAGWVLARFIEMNPPGPVRDNALSSDLHLVAWFELNSVATPSGDMPQYLVAGSRGAEGQDCDFTLLRVYTWDDPRQRYETAFLESDFCGKLPIHVFQNDGDPEFQFADADAAVGQRTYVMHKMMVRRVGPAERKTRAPRHSPK